MASDQPPQIAGSRWKKMLTIFLRLGITFAFFYYIFVHLIHFHDEILLLNGQKIQGSIESILPGGVSIKAKAGLQFFENEKIQKNKDGLLCIKIGFLSIFKKLKISLFVSFVLLFIINSFISALRFQWLLAAQNIIIVYFQAWKVTMMGLFFGNFLPGFTGGDLVKAYYITKESAVIAKSVVTVLVDRIVGLASLIVLVAIILLFQFGKSEFYLASLLIFSCLACLLLGIAFFFFCPKAWVYKRKNFIFRILQIFYDYQDKKKILAHCFFITFFIHIFTNIAIYGFALSLGITTIPWYTYFIYGAIGFLLMALPISLAGWGVGEAAYSLMFIKVGLAPEQAVVLSILVKIGQMIVSLIGGGVWLSLGISKKGKS